MHARGEGPGFPAPAGKVRIFRAGEEVRVLPRVGEVRTVPPSGSIVPFLPPDHASSIVTEWPSASRMHAQRTAVARLPLRERFAAGVITLMFNSVPPCVVIGDRRPLTRSLDDSAMRNRGRLDRRPLARSLGDSAMRNRGYSDRRPLARALQSVPQTGEEQSCSLSRGRAMSADLPPSKGAPVHPAPPGSTPLAVLSGIPPVIEVESSTLEAYIRDARARTRELIDDLTDAQLTGPRLRTVNPLRWEVGHVAWFHEHFILQRAYGESPLLAGGHALYDSIAIHHDARWTCPCPRARTPSRTCSGCTTDCWSGSAPASRARWTATSTSSPRSTRTCTTRRSRGTRQTLGYPRPEFAVARDPGPPPDAGAGDLPGDVCVPGGEFLAGAPGDAPFVFDNEKWCHPSRCGRSASRGRR